MSSDDQVKIDIDDMHGSGHASSSSSSSSAPSFHGADPSAPFAPSNLPASSLDDRMNVMEKNISMICEYIQKQEEAKVNAPSPSASFDHKSFTHHQQTPSSSVKDESSTPFHRGVTFQSDVGVNRDHTPHPVIAKIMSGYGHPSSYNSSAGNVGSSVVSVGGHPGRAASTIPSMENGGLGGHSTLPPMNTPPGLSPAGTDDGAGRGAGFVRISDEDRALLSVKLNMPSKYKGSMSHDSANLRIFISQMDRWFDAKKINHESPNSLLIAVTQLDGYASSWYENVRHEEAINSWSDLRSLMIQRFEREDIEEVETFALMDTKYRTNITAYTHEFNQHVQLVPQHLRRDQPMLILLYLHGLRVDHGTALLRVTLKHHMGKQGLHTLTQVQNEALRIESVLNSARSAGKQSAGATMYSNRTSLTPSSSRFSRATPPRRPTFSTPQKLHHVAAESGDHSVLDSYEDMNASIDDRGIDDGDEDSSGDTTVPSFHEDDESDSHGSSTSAAVDEVEHAMLHAMKAQAKFGAKLNISPEEILRCRKNNLCFKCKRPGHMATACPTSNGPSKKL